MKRLLINWKPHPKERPRATKGGVIYTPRKTKEKEEELRSLVIERLGEFEPFDGPCCVTIEVDAESVEICIEGADAGMPKSKLRGDIDNYGKLILDALNGVAWVDDKQIETLWIHKL